MIANRWIEQGYNAGFVLRSVGLAFSTYYSHKVRQSKNILPNTVSKSEPAEKRPGRPIPGYSYTYIGQKVSDEQIKKNIMEEITGDGYLEYYDRIRR